MDLLRDSVGRLYLKFLLPSLFSALVTTIYSFVDTIAIGQGVGTDGAAACAIIYPILGVASLFGFLCGIGARSASGSPAARGRKKRPTPTTRPRWFWCSFSRRSYGRSPPSSRCRFLPCSAPANRLCLWCWSTGTGSSGHFRPSSCPPTLPAWCAVTARRTWSWGPSSPAASSISSATGF